MQVHGNEFVHDLITKKKPSRQWAVVPEDANTLNTGVVGNNKTGVCCAVHGTLAMVEVYHSI